MSWLGALVIADVAIVLFTLILALRRRPRGFGLIAIALVMTGIAAWVLWISSNDDSGLSGLVTFPTTVLLTLLALPVTLVNLHYARRSTGPDEGTVNGEVA